MPIRLRLLRGSLAFSSSPAALNHWRGSMLNGPQCELAANRRFPAPPRPRVPRTSATAAAAHPGHGLSPLTASELDQARNAPLPFAKADVDAMSPMEREALRLRSKSIPLVVSHAPLDIVYEDAVFLVVCKPSWLKMHPIHRFQGWTCGAGDVLRAVCRVPRILPPLADSVAVWVCCAPVLSLSQAVHC
jgi:hypothetical protein